MDVQRGHGIEVDRKIEYVRIFHRSQQGLSEGPLSVTTDDRLIDAASGFRLLNFMDAYPDYNPIQMNSSDAPKTTFMMDSNIYYYKVMSFGLKNVRATYQRLMDMVFSSQIGRNLEVYVDDMLVKTEEEGRYADDWRETFQSLRIFDMRLNPDKCTFGVQADKFVGFMLTHRGINANSDKCQAIINMKSPTSIKEVQQLTRRLAALSRFLSCVDDKSIHLFVVIKKSAEFI